MPAFQRAEFKNCGAPGRRRAIYRPDGTVVGKERRETSGCGFEFRRKDGNPAVENVDRRLRGRRMRNGHVVGNKIDHRLLRLPVLTGIITRSEFEGRDPRVFAASAVTSCWLRPSAR